MMRVRHGVACFVKDFEVFFQCHLADAITPRNPLHAFHGVIRCAIFCLAQIVNRNDMWMNQVCRHQCFRQEHFATLFGDLLRASLSFEDFLFAIL